MLTVGNEQFELIMMHEKVTEGLDESCSGECVIVKLHMLFFCVCVSAL